MRHPVVVLLAALLVACGGGPQAHSEASLEERIARIENGLLPMVVIEGEPAKPMKLTDRLAHYNVPGVSVAVIRGGEIEWAKGYGVLEAGGTAPVTEKTLFQAASISKPVAATAALRLLEEGKLSLDENVNEKLKTWTVPENEFTKKTPVTLRGLLSHSAGMTVHGFPGYQADAEVPTLVQVLDGSGSANTKPIRVDIEPGTKNRYSGGGFTVMQLMMIDVAGERFPKLVKEIVLEPVGMSRSAYLQPLPEELAGSAAVGHRSDGSQIKGRWHTYPEMAAAGLWTTPSDLARFGIEIWKSNRGESNRVLKQATVQQMLTKQNTGAGLGMALWGADDAAQFGHGGANRGYRCNLAVYRPTGDGIAIMTNSDRGNAVIDEIIMGVAAEYGWPGRQPRVKKRVLLGAAALAAYAGKYEYSKDFVLTITAEDEGLLIDAPGRKQAKLWAESETNFFSLDRTVPEIVFFSGDSGAIDAMTAFGRHAKKVE